MTSQQSSGQMMSTPQGLAFVSDAESTLRTLRFQQQFPRVRLIEPTTSGFILLAAEVDERLPVFGASSGKRQLIDDCKRLCNALQQLDNSTVLRPVRSSDAGYTLINHCRWDRLRDVLPSLLFKRSFRTYVLAHFEANDTAPMPILYRLA